MEVLRFGVLERALQHAGRYANPYREVSAIAQLTAPGGDSRRSIPLFWDGGTTWRLRFSPQFVGTWQWQVDSDDAGLDGTSGTFEVAPSGCPGNIRPMHGYPHHLERQDGSRFWFLGETAWSLYVDDAAQEHDRAAAEHHLDVRAAQGFNAVHSMLMSELGWGNAGGMPFEDMASERINPAYWQEVDRRLAYLNGKGMVAGLVLAWGRKRSDDSEPFAWDCFPDLEAKTRYAHYIAARYGAYDVYWIVAGEWNASTRWRADAAAVEREYIAIGDALRAADPHERMIGIHPGTGGVHFVRAFNDVAGWMSFGDYQQNYTQLHAGVLASRSTGKPVINGEYAYYLRDARHDGIVDKPNSQSLDVIRHATWDIVMAGGYVVSGFGSTYLGGARNSSPFAVDAPQNDDWEAQVQHVPALFQEVAWWRLEPGDDLLRCAVPRGTDREIAGLPAPPTTTYWCLAERGQQYVLYVRGLAAPVQLSLDVAPATYAVRQFDPRSGTYVHLGTARGISAYTYQPPDASDWVVVLQRE
jgi:hypothetical protein